MRLGRRLVWWAGFVLIALGVGALVWSHQLSLAPNPAKNEWWQSTWQALGVGLMVGGLVDVLAITGLNWASEAEDRRRKRVNEHVKDLLNYSPPPSYDESQSLEVKALLASQILDHPQVVRDLDSDVLRDLKDAKAGERRHAAESRTLGGPPEDTGQKGRRA